MKIAIIGGGYVGLHTALKLTRTNRKWDIKVLDIDEKKINKFNKGESPIDDFYMKEFMKKNPGYLNKISYEKPDGNWTSYDAVFISLSTNPKKNDEARLNTDLIFKMTSEIKESSPKTSVTIRSTINIDDSELLDKLESNYWPEFLSQGVETLKNIDQNVNVVSLKHDDKVADDMFEELFDGRTLIRTRTKEAVFVKVMHNTLDAHLINLTNLFANISEENGMEFNNISSAVESLLSSRSKVKVPGIGYGGSCYPKDSYSLIEITDSEQNKKLIKSLDDFNKEQSYAFLYKENIIKKAKNIVVLGSSFKGGTNDITKTPTLSLRKWLLENKVDYKIWEPMISQSWTIDGEVISNDIATDIKLSDLVIVASDWSQFNDLLADYSGNVIDLKSYIRNNGKFKLYKIGGITK